MWERQGECQRMTCVEVKGQLEGTGSGLPSGYQATMQIIRLDRKRVYLLIHQAGPLTVSSNSEI